MSCAGLRDAFVLRQVLAHEGDERQLRDFRELNRMTTGRDGTRGRPSGRRLSWFDSEAEPSEYPHGAGLAALEIT